MEGRPDSEVDALRAEVARLRAEASQARARVAQLTAELDATRAMHHATVESLPFDFWARDRDGVCFSQNSASRRNWGELVHRRPEDMDLPREVIATWLANNRRALAGETVCGDVEYTVGGETWHIRNILAPIRQGDDIVGTLGVNIDLTELRRAEAERLQLERRLRETQRLETLGLLAGGVAHDINNIVMIVLGMTSLARRDVAAGSPLDTDLATIEAACRRAAAICNQLLAVAGKGRLARELLDLHLLAADTAQLVRPALPSAVELHVRAPNGQRLAAEVDATQLRQLLMNLILNASEAIDGRAGSITIEVGPVDPSEVVALGARGDGPALDPAREYVMLQVVDTGSGMSAETVARIFQPFFTTKARGRGLGLAAALGTVRAHGGALQVESAPGKGSTFRVLLPRASGLPPEQSPGASTDDWRGSGTALIIDDDLGVATAAARMVQAMGFETVVFASGQQALAQLRQMRAPALVLLDLMMPGLDGRTTLERIRDTHPAVPVVLMSGFHDLAEPPVGTPLLRKPFTVAELTHTVRDAVLASPRVAAVSHSRDP